MILVQEVDDGGLIQIHDGREWKLTDSEYIFGYKNKTCKLPFKKIIKGQFPVPHVKCLEVSMPS